MGFTKIFLGNNLDWDFFTRDDGGFQPSLWDCRVSVLCAILLILTRILCEKFLLKPLMTHLGLNPSEPKQALQNVQLEAFYERIGTKPSTIELRNLAEKTGMSKNEMARWLRDRRKLEDCQDTFKRSVESGWHVIYYSLSFGGSLYCLWNETWLWDTTLIWKGWPKQDVTPEMYWIYMIQIGHYMSLIFSILFMRDHRQKDTVQMTFHHCVTIALMVMSWRINSIRVGVIILILHDIADPGLNLSKILYHGNMKPAAEKVFFPAFAVWIVSRMIYFPFKVLRSTMIDFAEVNKVEVWRLGFYWMINVLLWFLMTMHVHWTVLFSKIMYQKFMYGEVKKDEFVGDDTDLSESEREDCSDSQFEEAEDGGSTVAAGENNLAKEDLSGDNFFKNKNLDIDAGDNDGVAVNTQEEEIYANGGGDQVFSRLNMVKEVEDVDRVCKLEESLKEIDSCEGTDIDLFLEPDSENDSVDKEDRSEEEGMKVRNRKPKLK